MNAAHRRWSALLLSLASLCLLPACGGDDDDNTASSAGASGKGAGGKGGSGGSGGSSGKSAGGQGGSSGQGGSGGSAGSAGSAQAGKGGSGGSSQAGQGGSSQAGQGGSSQAGSGGSSQAGSGGSSQAGSGGSSQAGAGGSEQAGSGGSSQAGSGGSSQAGQGGSGGSAQAGGGGSAQAGSSGSAGQGGGSSGPTVGEWLGMNGFVNDPDEVLTAGGVVREYHTWEWNQHYWDQNGEHKTGVDSMVFQGMVSTWNLDDFFKRLHDAKVDVFPAIQGTIPAVSGTTDFPKPMPQGADAQAPASYIDHAKMMFQFAARYGQTKVDEGKLTLASGQPKLSGAGYLRYIENGNEPDNTYAYGLGGKAFPQTAPEFAAMSSADYDGHKGALGPGVGVKTADPKMTMLMAGLAGSWPTAPDPGFVANITDYLKGIKAWADKNRGGSIPFDVVNLHYYCLDYGKGHGVAPEACGLEATIRDARKASDAITGGLPFWITEFGYDRVQGSSWNEATPVGPYDAETVQAQWLIRGALAILLAGADRFTMYMSRDAGADGLFATSGLVNLDLADQKLGTVKDRYAAFYYLATFHKRLSAMRLDAEVPSGNPSVRVVRFAGDGGERGYALWCPTADGTKVDGYKLAVEGATSATEVKLAKGAPNGNEAALSVSAGSVSVDVSENPVLVLTK